MQIIRNSHNRIVWFCIICLVALYVSVFIRISLCKYFNFIYNDWDLAIYNQVFRGLINGKPYISLADVSFPGIHGEITLTLITPIYALFSHPVILLIIQSVILGLAAIPLFLITSEKLNNIWGLIFVIIYLFYPAVGYTNLNEFHAESFLPFIQFFLLYFFIKDDFKKFIIFMFLCLFAKENMSLIVIMLGFYALINKRKNKWIILPILSGIIWFLFYLKVLSPSLNQGKVEFYSLYGHLGRNLTQIAWSIISHPIKILKFMFIPQKLNYLFNLFGPLSFLSFFSPLILLIPAPNFLQHLLSLRMTETTLYFYYPSEILAFIFISAIFGLKFLLRLNLSRKLVHAYYVIVPIIAIFFSIQLGPQLYMLRQIRLACRETDAVKQKNNFITMIPRGSSVVSTFEFLPKLSNITDKLYSFHRVITGLYNPDTKFTLPEEVNFALIDFNDSLTFRGFFASLGGRSNLMNFFKKNHWGPVEVAENIVLFKKNYHGDISLFESVESVARENLVNITFDNDIELLSYKIKNSVLKKEDKIQLTFFWRRIKAIDKDYWLFTMFLDSDGKIIYNSFHPLCYRIYPSNTWKEKEIIREDYRMLIPSYINKGNYNLCLGIFDSSNGKSCRVSSDTIKERNAWWINLTDISII